MFHKQCLILFCIVVLQTNAIPPAIKKILPPEVLEIILLLRDVCTKEVGLTSDDIDNFKFGVNKEEKYKCYMKCLMLQGTWMTPDGVIQYDTILETTHPLIRDVLEGALSKCRNIPDTPDQCEKAFKFNECMWKAEPIHYFLP